MRKKNVLFFLAMTALVFLGFSETTLQVAVVNPIRALQGSDEGKKAMSLLQEKEKQIVGELNKLDQQAKDIELKLQSQKLVLSIEAQQKLARELDRVQTQRKRAEEDFTKEFQELEFRLMNPIKEKMLAIIGDISKEKGYGLVFDLSISGVAYYDPNVDITDEVITKYNALHK